MNIVTVKNLDEITLNEIHGQLPSWLHGARLANRGKILAVFAPMNNMELTRICEVLVEHKLYFDVTKVEE